MKKAEKEMQNRSLHIVQRLKQGLEQKSVIAIKQTNVITAKQNNAITENCNNTKTEKRNNINTFRQIRLLLAIVKLFFLQFFFVQGSYAGAYNNFGKIWENSGGVSSVNNPSYYKGQKSGHYTMGSMYFAREQKNRPLVSVRFPDFNFDKSCYSQGVLNFGGMSFISGPELINKIQSIATQAGMMFVYQGFSSISPVIGETLQEVYSKLQELGGFLSDECQAAKALNGAIGDVMTGHSSMAQSIMTRFGTGSGDKTDLSTAYKDYPKNKSQALSNAANKDESLILEDVNLAWKALEKLKISNNELKKFMMSVSGTIIIHAPKNDSSPPNFQYISSNITSPELLKTLLKGGDNLPVIECTDTQSEQQKCLSVKAGKQSISKDESFEQRVVDYFEKFKQAIKDDADINDNDTDIHSFLASSGLPVYKIYDVLYQYSNGSPQYEQGVFIEVVAWNILYNYLSDTLQQVTEAANNLQIAAAPQLKEFKASLVHTQKMLDSLQMKDLSRYKMQLFLVNRAENYERVMADEVSTIYSSMSN
jgi:conjugative transfer pilus assembly protein TraH